MKKELTGTVPDSTPKPPRQKRAPPAPGKKRGPPANAFPKGVSANPNGKPAGLTHVRELARTYTTEAVEKMASIMRSGKSERAQVAACEGLLNRAWGKPDQFVDVNVSVEHKSALVDKILAAIQGRQGVVIDAAEPAQVVGPRKPAAGG